MSALREAMSHAVLGWVKPELDETLRQARIEIEDFAADPTDTSRMRFCAGYLHQVQGTLRMVELYAPAMVAEEMELLAQVLQQGAAADRDEACATLMRGTVLLPDYLERLQNGHRDIPIVLLPLLNDLRAARGAAGLNESVLFAPDLSRPLPELVPEAAPLPWNQRHDRQASAQARFDLALATWPDQGAPEDPVELAAAAAALLENAGHDTTRRMLWVLSSTAAALRDGVLAASTSLRAAFAGVARAVRQAHADDQFASSDHGVASQEPTRQLLYLVAQTSEAHPALDALRQAFGLDALTPSQAELDHARGSLSGRNSDLLNTVGGVVKEELLRVKDVLDLHLRTGGNAADLQPQAAELANVADTLGMLGLGVAREVVLQQRDALDAIARGEQPASESALLDIAGALLYVDASLDDQVSRLGAPGEDAGDEATAAEARRTMEVLAHEAITNFGAAREHFVAFIETNWDHERLVDVPGLLSEVSGALRILDLLPPADYLEGVRRYIATELLQRRRVPSGRQLDTLADAMASLEYYLEALRDRRPNSEQILEIARTSLENLHYWPLPDEAPAALPAEPVAVAEPAVAGFAPAAAIVIAPAASAASAWDPVAAEHDADLVAPEPEPEPEPQAPEAEPLEAPGLQIETPAIEPATVTAPTPLAASAGWISFDPVSAESVDTSPAEEATAAVVEVGEAGAETETEAVDAPLQVTAVGDTGQWLGSGMNAQPDLRPAQVHDGRVSHIDLDQASQSVVAEITAAAAGLATGVEATGEPQAAMPVVGGFDDAADIDADIREVFLEEFDEERDNLGRLVPHWQQAPEDLDRARPIRRVFHTLKGRTPGRCTRAGRVQLEDRGHAQSRARWQPRAEPGGAGDGGTGLPDPAAVRCGPAWPGWRGRRPARDGGGGRSHRRRGGGVLPATGGGCAGAGRWPGRGVVRRARRHPGYRLRPGSGRRHAGLGGQRPARDPGGRGQPAPGERGRLGGGGTPAAPAGDRRPAASDPHHERRVRDDRRAGNHHGDRAGRNLCPALAGHRPGAGHRRGRGPGRDGRRRPYLHARLAGRVAAHPRLRAAGRAPGRAGRGPARGQLAAAGHRSRRARVRAGRSGGEGCRTDRQR